MIIGIDAGSLSVTDERLRVGVFRVTYNLLRVLGEIDRKNEYRLYSFRPLDKSFLEAFGPRMTNQVLRPLPGWFTLRLPIELRVHPVDVFLGLSQAIPFGVNKSIGFVYDLGFLHYPNAYPGSYGHLQKRTEDLAKRSTNIVAISKTTAEDLVKTYKYPKKEIEVVYPGVGEEFKPSGEKYRGKHPYILFVGALKKGKNVPAAIRAFDQFLKQSKKTYDFLLIGGNFWEDSEIKRTIKQLDLSDRVKSLGHVADAELPKYYRGASVFITPSLWEGFCLPAAEAMASGVPVIGSTNGSLPEIIGDAGITVDPDNEIKLAESLNNILSNETVRKRMVAKGLSRAKLFSWNKFGQRIFDIIHHV